MISSNISRRCLTIGMLSALAVFGAAQTVDPSLLSGLQWRNIGPFRGGRVSAVSGVIGEPGTFYMGLPAGGVWKTTSAGMTWYPIFDDIKSSSSVGAVAVAPSDPNTIYVGMGDFTNGGGVSMGDGVYKSTDAGKTWQHVGLDFAEQIPTILVDPKDPNIVMVAVQGKRYEKTDQRGVYRSTDGGKTWTKSLYIDDQTGITRMAWAPDHPEVILASSLKHYTDPTARGGGFGGFGGGGGGPAIYMSTDEGVTWNKLDGTGLPDSGGGARSCVAVANGTNAQRMFFVSNVGLYRSDDQGKTWTQMDKEDDRVRNGQGGYNCGVYVNPKDPDTVYVINTCSYISHDGGKTFTGFKGAPGGDDPQQMWLDPTDGNRILLGMDQGATVTLDGGQNWSSWYNQPSAQLYHISVDTQFPYWVYGTEQDSGSIASASRGNFGEITPLDWLPHPGYEFGSIVADPNNPKISYAGGPARGIIRTTYPSGQWMNVSPNMDRSARLRQVSNQALAFNPNNSKELLTAFQYMMDTTDGGLHWKKLSPDLTLAPGQTEEQAAAAARPPRPGGNVVNDDDADYNGPLLNGDGSDGDEDEVEEMQRGGFGAAIESFSVSTVTPSEMWVGTSNGRIQLTQDGGKSWHDVSIPNPPNGTRADISAIDASHQDPGTAYVAVDCHNAADMNPYFYRTHDFGKTWTEIVNGLPADQPSGSFARVIRTDTKRSGLLFAGTESSMYVSFNDGDQWQPLMLNLPITSYRDMVIKDNDLVVGTYGRGMWILDDYSPLREITPAMSTEAAHLFKPGDAIRVRHNVNGDTPYPPEVPHALNPPDGALIYYYLGAKPSGDVNIDITDSAGHLVRHMSSAAMPAWNEPAPPEPDFWIDNPKPIPAELGLNRINWDLRYDSPDTFEHSYEINANPNGTQPSPQGILALPGTYTVTMTVGGQSYKQTVEVKNDPRSPASSHDVQEEFTMQKGCYDGSEDAWKGYQQVDAMRTAVKNIEAGNPSTDVKTACDNLLDKLDSIGGQGQAQRFAAGVGFGGGGGSTGPTFSTLNRTMIGHIETLDSGDMAPSDPMMRACATTLDDLNTAEWNWKQFNAMDLVDFNALLTKNNLTPIPAAAGVGNPHQPPAPKPEKKTDDKKSSDAPKPGGN